tara:strand:- start:16840 stop:17058 length:219 start_codon:yes stop_codon:yes gene_type:complete
MILNDGTKVNYGTIRVTQNMSKLICYGGLREIFKPDVTEAAKRKAEGLKKCDEVSVLKSEPIAKILLSEIKE